MRVTYERYEEGSWDSWEKTLTGHKSRTYTEDRNAFLPSPEEIELRKEMLRWLQTKKFSKRLICAVMQHDHPGFDIVHKLTDLYGSRETERRLRPFLPSTEYDNED